VKPQRAISKPERADVLLSRFPDGRFVSFFGDLHPSYSATSSRRSVRHARVTAVSRALAKTSRNPALRPGVLR